MMGHVEHKRNRGHENRNRDRVTWSTRGIGVTRIATGIGSRGAQDGIQKSKFERHGELTNYSDAKPD
ncbi:hypothetical protein RRG08_050081 [Elysia crispata]|uniref:Uncharacterized protein n=1 Tax=Elysia crispata TaxID=231223 RepID=A0AAE1ALB4_9GAST|nr:hypothetical protein RRG08_050081 [Elysia crispata]